MQYNPKLKKAAEEIKVILSKYDIAAAIVLHTPGHGEHLLNITPSYSALETGATGVRLKATKVEYPDKELRVKAISDTANMLGIMAEIIGKLFLYVDEMSQSVDKAVNATHDRGSSSSHIEQNN